MVVVVRVCSVGVVPAIIVEMVTLVLVKAFLYNSVAMQVRDVCVRVRGVCACVHIYTYTYVCQSLHIYII